jgi:hypothetical protein
LRAALDQTTNKLEALDARIAKGFPQYSELSNPKPLAAEAAKALLTPDEAMLVYLAADDATWVWVLRRDRIAFHHIEIGAKALAHQVSAVRGALDPLTTPISRRSRPKTPTRFTRNCLSRRCRCSTARIT